ncbi:MAG: GMC family oxidoreductase [Actinobacteria bacterium]|jgi:cholesterol oxidase|nr:GMC family oxidoreductase [Micrococcales bacterium]MCB0904884.1 GMC family oxidoreductase [Actinomycetota bacterium]MCO5299890.1 GMC oxidoreductase [Candidatus Nanopelagicales bacterium]MCB9429641.1 GMC family oxidoreductase [Actinomycetota bacterium]HPE13159.1 GMC oxidoreductase [Actinomycetota bacterium]
MAIFDVAVIGSGFGGSVAALRAAQAGKRVVVLEQGRRLAPADLEAGAKSTRALLWEPALGLHGYFRQTLLRHLTIVGGVGVGGGSIVYAAVMLKPKDYAGRGWTAAGIDWATELEPHFAEAARMLGRERNPQRGIQDQWLQAAAEHMGVGETYGATYQGISFADCIACGQCITGCPHGAKNSTDLTYLAQAEDLGAQILALSKAHILVPVHDGWRVVVRNPLTQQVSSVEAKEVVVAAGVLGTVELLSACRDRWKTLPELSSMLGRRVRTNSEAFSAILHPPGTDVTHGATISSDFYPNPDTHVTNNRFPKSYGFMRWYLSPLVSGDRRRETLRAMLTQPEVASANARAKDWHKRITILTVMQRADNEMALSYRKGPLGWALRSEIPAGVDPVPVSLPEADAAGRAVAEVSGGRAYATVLDSLLGMGATAHILGGAVLGPDPDSGVVDTDLQVHGYPGLRVMDGSVMPENVGVNPSWTITAMAERACARWLGG